MNYFLLIFFVIGCVGTVENKNLEKTKSAQSSVILKQYKGLVSAEAISHDKVELAFTPDVGVADDISYFIYVNNSSVPIQLSGSSLKEDRSGMYIYTVRYLDINTPYSFSLSTYNSRTNINTEISDALYTKTFSNITSDFSGVVAAAPLKGEAGKNSIRVSWTPASYTGVSPFFPDTGDVIGYELTYAPASLGIDKINDDDWFHPKKIKNQVPSSFGSNPFRSTESSRVVSGLETATQYYFRVRAIHKGFVDFGGNASYKLEQNSIIASASTLPASGSYDFDSNSLISITPDGDGALSKIGIRWTSAVGEFNSYRVYAVNVVDENVPDKLLAVDIDTLNVSSDYSQLNADATYSEITGLLPYEWYQVKIVACQTSSCGDGQRILSKSILHRTIPKISPFGGIVNLNNPSDETALDLIEIDFNPPVISAGYLNDLELYCYSDRSDVSPVLMSQGVAVTASGKANCDGLTRNTNSPATFPGFEGFEKIEIDGITVGQEYCFSLVPVINGLNGFSHRDITNSSVKCFVPEVQTPRIEEFAGRTPGCSVDKTSINVSWEEPTAGLYTNFEVFWKESDGTSFKFSKAVLSDPGYFVATGISKPTRSYTIPNLTPGKSYHVAVLTYLDDGSKYYSEFNSETNECNIPLPIATFDEWTQVFAIGPKVNGLIPKNAFGEEEFLVETLDDDLNGGVPLEVLIDAGDPTGKAIDVNFQLPRGGSTAFNGVYGSRENDPLNPLNQYSDTGIIRFAWKDVSFYEGTVKMNDLISTYELIPPLKKDRLFGYKVLRSEDNKLTWTELTNADYDFQTVTNSGLVRATSRSSRKRNNSGVESEDIVIFTDYSVKNSNGLNGVERARIYQYKIIPVFNGIPLKYTGSNSQAHIIQITLPPKNMALVHRMMANRTLCHEIGKDVNKEQDEFYSCEYNGLGASSLNGSGIQGNTVYDLGADLLIDRFELGCNLTRGNPAAFNSYGGALEDFTDTGFKGCIGNGTARNEPRTYDPAIDYTKVVSGDCFGRDKIVTTETTCSSTNAPTRSYAFPGASGGDVDCTLPNNNREDYRYNQMAPQSEYAAVYYTREFGRPQANLPGANGGDINLSSYYASGCYINLYGVDTTNSNKIKSRWIASNNTFDDRLTDTGLAQSFTIFDKTLTEILGMTELYNADSMSAPVLNYSTNPRISGDSKIGRILSSNNPKLPPLRNLAQEDLDNICSLYEVEVGFEKSNNFYPTQDVRKKRVIRKKEQIVASAWPDNSSFDEAKVTSIEDGSLSSSFIGGIGSDSDGCGTGSRYSQGGRDSFSVGDDIFTLFPQVSDASRIHVLLTGSSSLDGGGRNTNTQRCVSKFGIQDMVGNVAEYTSDQIFCDFSGETLYLGVDGDVGNSIQYAPLKDTYQLYNSMSLTAWVDSAPNTGSCSTVESGGGRTGSAVVGSLFTNIFDSNGQPDPLVLLQTKTFDQGSVLNARNGDGFFLDFGQLNLGPPLSQGNTLSLGTAGITDDNRRAKYFNPVLGMPLECLNGSCDNSDDNQKIVTNAQVLNGTLSLNPLDYEIPDFPVNNSQIFNYGIRDIYNHDGAVSPNPYGGPFDYINSISATSSFTVDATHPTPEIEYLSADGVVDTVVGDRVDFRVNRGVPMYMITGGTGQEDTNGRYSFDMEGISRSAQASWKISDSSGRCVVRINEN